ncbi:metalloregulator ArsR/SmtB family transcription factor [bacterium]|nr:metalloregulator ArsR/SmtB family transcription factor [bacterium]MBU1984207.1 metalloregulator ArsR/SmtB family transcription factor [bacterium]
MDDRTHTRLIHRANVFKSLAHPTRLFIVEELAKGPQCVCELTALIGADVSTVSKHLSVLKNAGVVRDEKRGAQVWYELRMPCVLSFFDCVERAITARAEWQLELEREP